MRNGYEKKVVDSFNICILLFSMEIGQTDWYAADIGIGQTNTCIGENWAVASWYEDGEKNSTYSSTDIDLTLSEDAQGHNVLIIRREGSSVNWTPTQSTEYSDDQDLGTNHEVVKGSYDPSTNGTTVNNSE